METLVWDTESNGLLDEADRLHSVQIGTVAGDDTTVYCDALPGYRPIAEGLARLAAADKLIGQNVIAHDFPLVAKLHPGTLRREQMVDTLVMLRLKDPEERSNSLKAVGERLGVRKGDFEGPWDVCTPEMMAYAAMDIPSTRAAYNYAKEVETWGESLALEHEVAWAIQQQERNGFCFDVKAAEALDAELRGEVAAMSASLREVFPPMWVASDKAPFTPKGDNRRFGYNSGCPLSKVECQTFNPASRHHVAARLQRLGWKPRAFGQDGHPTVDETVLASLPYPEAQRLVAFFGLNKKLGMLSDGPNGWLKMVGQDGRIHGRVNPNGAVTGRMAHFGPNVAQADKDPRMRSLWLPRAGWKLVGCDADGIEARMLAHYLARYDGGAFANMLLNGTKEAGTDVHSANAKAVNRAGFEVDRDGAKTLLYALMYGAGDWKIGETVRQNIRARAFNMGVPNKEAGRLVRRALERSMRGLGGLTADLKAAAGKRGYLVGLDGRHLTIRHDHAVLNTLLQSAGAVVMKEALAMFMRQCGGYHGVDFGLCANIHDEVQLEATPDMAENYGITLADCIARAGAHFNLRCPTSGSYALGDNWAETH